MKWDRFGSITVLIADDDAFNRQLIISLLSKIPTIKYIEAENGIEALEYLAKEKIDIILLDLHMPKLSGMDAIKEIKKDKELSLIPIIIISTDELISKKLKTLGADDFLSKPFKLSELQSKIYKYIEQLHKKREELNSQNREVDCSNSEKILESIEKSQIEIFKGLAYILSLKDKYIGVSAKLVKAFAELLNYKKEDVERLYLVTLVYNIGALSHEQFRNSHTNILEDKVDNREIMSILQGYQIVKNTTKTPFMDMLKAVITQSRENYNGTGIPRQLKGDAISPYAQIVHIVETFNILLKDNPKESVYQFFKGQSGEWFNPKLLEPFLDYFDYFIELRKKYIKDN